MMIPKIKNKIGKGLITLLILGQLAFSFNFLLVPKKAEAFWGIGDFTFTTEVTSWYDIFKDIGLGIAERLAVSYANKYLQKFTQQVLDKYRIKDYMAYDKVLSGYYLNQYVYQNVDDPDLRGIYNLLATDINNRAYVCPTGMGSTCPDTVKQPVLAALREKLDNYYYGQGGIDSRRIYYPVSSVSDREYFATARAYFANPPVFSRQDTLSRYSQIQNSAQNAARLEIPLGDGLKNDRSFTGTLPSVCTGPFVVPLDADKLPESAPGPLLQAPQSWMEKIGLISVAHAQSSNPRTSEAACRASGGTWEVDKTGVAISAIQNPATFISNFVNNGIETIFSNNFKMGKNMYSAIGSLLGNFIFTKLNLNSDSTTTGGFDGTFNETGSRYSQNRDSLTRTVEVDEDGDTVPDGQDNNSDGLLSKIGVDSCYHGDVQPGEAGYVASRLTCKKSTVVLTSPYFTPICTSLDRAIADMRAFAKYIDDNAEDIQDGASLKGRIIAGILTGGVGVVFPGIIGLGGNDDNFKNEADAQLWARRASLADASLKDLVNNIEALHVISYMNKVEHVVNQHEAFLGEVVNSLQKDSDLDLSGGFWNVGSGGGGLENLMKDVAYTLRYLIAVRATIGKCEDPNFTAVEAIPLPPISSPTPGGSGGDFDTCAEFPSRGISCTAPNHVDLVQRVKDYLIARGISIAGTCGAFEITKRVAWTLRGEGVGNLATWHTGACNGLASGVIAYTDKSEVDILGDEGGANNPQWIPGLPNPESGVYYVPPSDPGDPAGSY